MGSTSPPQRSVHFWTDHYGHRIEVCGEMPAGLTPTMVDGNVAQDRVVAVFGDVDHPLAVTAGDNPRTFMRLT